MNAPRASGGGVSGGGVTGGDTPALPGEEADGGPVIFTLADLLAALRRHWRLVLLLTVIGGVGGYAFAKTIVARYRADATLISDAALAAISDGTGRDNATIVDPSAAPTIVESIASPVVLRRALGALTPELRARLVAEAGIDASEAAGEDAEDRLLARFLSETLKVTNSGRSYVIYVSHVSADPELAAAVANAVARAYLDYRAELKRYGYSLYLGSLDTELTALKSELQVAERTAQTMREQGRLLAARTEAVTGRAQEEAIEKSAGLYARQREAEREAEAAAAVYERLLLNQREVQSRLSTPELDVQLFAPAAVPLRPSGFNVKPFLLALGLAGGFCLGASLALFRERRGAPRRR